MRTSKFYDPEMRTSKFYVLYSICTQPNHVNVKGVGWGVDRNLNQFESLPRELQTSIRMLVGGGTRAVVRIAPFYALYELGKRSRAALNAIKSTVVTRTISRALYTHSNLLTFSPRAQVCSSSFGRAHAAVPRVISRPGWPQTSPVQPSIAIAATAMK